ncbi:MAG: Kef-type transport system, predicted NAD-binding component [Gammaproteobacteria bacterium]|jgi:Kef-type K+ transport system membrane component KefB|nr:Kef-type transport system, predicted NAD-binding component [Gammaproteobacteria bacterium]
MGSEQQIIFVIFSVFIGAVIFSTIAIFLRQSLLVAYILLGLFLGPYGAQLVSHVDTFSHIGQIGIIFLLFLVGIDMDPRELAASIKQVSFMTIGASISLIGLGIAIGHILHFDFRDSLLISVAIIFSSTVIGLKLMPSHDLFHTRRGDLMVGILLLQDLLAIFALFLLNGARTGDGLNWQDLVAAGVGMPTLLIAAVVGKQLLIRPLARYFWHIKEYVFILSIAWCLSMAEFGSFLGLSDGVGAFVAGVTIASNSRTAGLMRERLNPLRDFFLILFFFSVGAGFNYHAMEEVLLPGLVFCALAIIMKPLLFWGLLKWRGESSADAKEVGFRLGQGSEFSLLIAGLAADVAPRLISIRAEYTIELMTLVSFILSCFYITRRYPTPIVQREEESGHHLPRDKH